MATYETSKTQINKTKGGNHTHTTPRIHTPHTHKQLNKQQNVTFTTNSAPKLNI